ncbi:MAG: hypothetical protein J6D47_16735 [Peptostreptococcaceae bacterium]|nr:hypothetical protein [Peptostreptococcaceae bacterium]MBP3931195.1 hypothetical protein [Peptostreptococcaceae bacterium]
MAAREIKVNIEGRISEYNLRLFSERLASILIKRLGEENSRALLELMKSTDVKKA